MLFCLFCLFLLCFICFCFCFFSISSFMMRSSKMSLKSEILFFIFILFYLFIFFLHFLLGCHLSFNLLKMLWRLGNLFSRNSILSDCKNNKKQKKLSALFGYIFKLIFASSDSFCLIASHLLICYFLLFFSFSFSFTFYFTAKL